MLFFYSRTVLEDALRRQVRPEGGRLTADELPVIEAVGPAGRQLSRLLRVPAWLRPTDSSLLQAVRPLTDSPPARQPVPSKRDGGTCQMLR